MECGQNICNMGNINNNNQILFNQMQNQMNPMMMQNQMNQMMINNEINDYKYEDVYDYIKEYKKKLYLKE